MMENTYVEKMIEDNIGLIAWGYKKYCESYPVYLHDEIYSLANYSLYKSVIHYKPEMENKFSTFYSKVLKNEINHYIRRINTKSRKSEYGDDISLSSTIKHADDLDIESLLSINDSLDDNIILHDLLNQLNNTVDDISRKIISLKMNNCDLSQRDIAKYLNISQPHVCRKLNYIKTVLYNIIKS